jgi:hypothetical protein
MGAASMAGADGSAPLAHGGKGQGTLNVRERFDPEGGLPIEGYIPFAVVRKAGSGRVVLRAKPSFHRNLPAGRYRLSSYMRTCDGNCGFLDPPTNKCATTFELERRKTTTIRVLRRADRSCELVVSRTG